MGNCFWRYFRQMFISSFRKHNKLCHIPEIIPAQGFCTLITEIARLPIGIRLKLYQETFLVCKKMTNLFRRHWGRHGTLEKPIKTK